VYWFLYIWFPVSPYACGGYSLKGLFFMPESGVTGLGFLFIYLPGVYPPAYLAAIYRAWVSCVRRLRLATRSGGQEPNTSVVVLDYALLYEHDLQIYRAWVSCVRRLRLATRSGGQEPNTSVVVLDYALLYEHDLQSVRLIAD
jgi:hypothetical protein